MEVRRLVPDPMDEFRDGRIGTYCIRIITDTGKFSVGEVGVDRLVTDRMNRDSSTPFLGLRDGVMPLDQRVERPFAQPAGQPAIHAWSLLGISIHCTQYPFDLAAGKKLAEVLSHIGRHFSLNCFA